MWRVSKTCCGVKREGCSAVRNFNIEGGFATRTHGHGVCALAGCWRPYQKLVTASTSGEALADAVQLVPEAGPR